MRGLPLPPRASPAVSQNIQLAAGWGTGGPNRGDPPAEGLERGWRCRAALGVFIPEGCAKVARGGSAPLESDPLPHLLSFASYPNGIGELPQLAYPCWQRRELSVWGRARKSSVPADVLLSGQKGRDAVVSNRKVGGDDAVSEYRQPLLRRISPFLEGVHAVADPSGRLCRWTPAVASMAAILMALDPGCALGVRCEDALACLDREGACCRVGRTYNGLLKALERQEHTVLPSLKTDLRRHARTALAKIPRVTGWTLLAVDGSKEELPRTRSHEFVFGISDNG